MYQIFISYRRDGGEFLGKMLHERLTAMGYSVFYDVEGLNPGRFNTQLLDVIASCTDFLLVLSPGAMDRCAEPGDWVYQEVTCALQHGKNFIPIMMRSFEWPQNLPAPLRELPAYEALTANNEYFDALLDRLAKKFLKSKPARAPAGAGAAAPAYAVTAGDRWTEAVQVMVSYLVKEGIDITILREYTRLVESFSRGTAAFDLTCWQRAMDFLQKSALQQAAPQALGALQRLQQWILQQNDAHRAELLSFFHAYNALWSVYDVTTGQPRDYALRDTLTYEGGVCEIRDVLPGKPGTDERFLYCCRQGAALLPETLWFTACGGTLRQLSPQEEGALISGLTINYATDWRLFDSMPLWITQHLTEQDMQRFPPSGTLQAQLRIQKLFRPEIIGQFEVRRLLSRATVHLTLGLDSVRETQQSGKDAVFTPFHENVPLDIADATPYLTTPDSVYYVLTCPQGAEKDKFYLRNAPKVYRVTVSRESRALVWDEVTNPRQLPPGLGERFATRLAVYRIMGAVG